MTLKPFVLRQGLILKQDFVLLKQSCINLEAVLILLKQPCLILLWHHQNHVCIHSHSSPFWWWQSSDFFSTSSKDTWFTFSPFLMMTLIIKLILFYIIKTCMIHILPLVDDDDHCRLRATTTKNIYLYIVLLPLGFGMFAYMRQLKIS